MQTNIIATRSTPRNAGLMGLMKRALRRDHQAVPFIARDHVETRAQRTRKGKPEGEFYEDGSGFEVAFLGYVFMLGVERRSDYAVRTTPSV